VIHVKIDKDTGSRYYLYMTWLINLSRKIQATKTFYRVQKRSMRKFPWSWLVMILLQCLWT